MASALVVRMWRNISPIRNFIEASLLEGVLPHVLPRARFRKPPPMIMRVGARLVVLWRIRVFRESKDLSFDPGP